MRGHWGAKDTYCKVILWVGGYRRDRKRTLMEKLVKMHIKNSKGSLQFS